MGAIPRPRPPYALTFFATSLACFLLLSPQAHAWPGDLDLSFNASGFRKLSFPRGNDFATAAAVQSDGKVVVVGRTQTYSEMEHWFVVRLTSDGILDPSFGTGGKVITRIGVLRSGATGVKLQTDGKIVVCGYASNSFAGENSAMAILRYNADGTLDPTFAGDGIQLLGFPGEDSTFATALTLQSDGKIVAVGKTGTDDSDDFAIIRLNTDGTADGSFAGDGTLRTSFGSGEESAEAVAIQSDGKIVVAGWTSGASYHNIALSRYSPGGVLDLTFDGDGKVVTDLGANSRAMTLTIHNRLIVQGFTIVVGGYRGSALFFGRTGTFGEGTGGAQMAVLRYQADGELDDSFSGDGITYAGFPSGTMSAAMSIAVQSPQLGATYLVAGFTGNDETGPGPDMEFGLARFESDGTPDTSLAGDGTLAIGAGTASRDYGFAVALSSNKIIAAGWSQATGLEPNAAVFRFNSADGSTDSTFSGDGLAVIDVGPSYSIANDVKAQSDGKIVVAGMGAASMALARLQPDGSPDTSFNLDGMLYTKFPTFPYSQAEAVAIAPDGKLVAAGSDFETFDSRFAVARFLPSGLLDLSFNGDGKLTSHIGGADFASDIIVLAGKIHVIGTAAQPSTNTDDFTYARYDTNGSLEDLTVTQIEDESHAAAMAVQPSGKIVAVGTATAHISEGPDHSKIVVVRYSSVSGEVDATFGEAGIVSIDFGDDSAGGADITVDRLGRIVVIGNVGGNGVVARLTVDGDPDETFASGLDGITTPLNGVAFRSVDIQSDGQIVVAGESGNEVAVVRFRSTGVLSSTYGENGVARTSLGPFTVGNPPRVRALSIDSLDRAIVAGQVDGEMVVVRLLGDPSYFQWTTQEFPLGPPSAAAPEADPDGDGLANSLEYLLASDPWSFTLHPLTVRKVGNSAELLFTLRRDRFDVSYEILRSDDLGGSWQAATGTTDSRTVGAFTSFQFIPVTNGPSAFFKLGATISPP